MKILVGSKNESKIKGVNKAFNHYFSNFAIDGMQVESEVNEQPVDSEIFQGAINRVKNLKQFSNNADYYVAVESGLTNFAGEYLIVQVGYIEDKQGRSSMGMSAGFPVPEKLITQIKSLGLNNVVKQLFPQNTKIDNGTVGILTDNVISRVDLTEQAIVLALTKFLKKEWQG